MSRKRPGFEREETVIEAARAREGIERKNELVALGQILQDEKVRDFLWRVMEKSSMFAEQFNANFGVTGHNLGRAAMGKYVMTEILEADPNAWLAMQAAHYQRQMDAAAIAAAEEARASDDST